MSVVTGNRLKAILEVGSTVLVAAASVAVLWLVWVRGNDIQATSAAVATRPGPIDINLELASPALANSTARPKVAVVEFSDYQCPFSGRYARDVYPHLRKQFVDTGTVDYQFRHFPLERIHPMAFHAAEATECAKLQGKGAQMHEAIFAGQGSLGEADVTSYATRAGIDVSVFGECMNGRMKEKVQRDVAEGNRLGVTSTPTFLLGRVDRNGTIKLTKKLVGLPTPEDIDKVIATLLSQE